jgi:hypothetical protein
VESEDPDPDSFFFTRTVHEITQVPRSLRGQVSAASGLWAEQAYPMEIHQLRYFVAVAD